MLRLLFTIILLFFGASISEIQNDESPKSAFPKYPWSEYVPKLEFTTPKPDKKKSNMTRQGLVEEFKNGRIPQELVPFLDMNTVKKLSKENNETLDFIIRDEDVADIPDDDVNDRRVNTLTHDGNKSILTISDEAEYELYKHWLDQSLSGLMGAVVTNVINKRKMTKLEKKNHYACTQSAKNVTSHAKCVVAVYDQLKKRDEKLRMYSTLIKKLNTRRRVHGKLKSDSWKSAAREYEKFVKSGAEEFRVKRAVEFGLFGEYERQKKIQRNIKNRETYELKMQNESPLATIAKRLRSLVRAGKNATDPPKRWQEVISEIKEETTRIKKKKRSKERLKKKFSKFASTMKRSGINPKQALQTVGMDDIFEEDDPMLSEREMDIKERKEMFAALSPEEKMLHEPIKLIRDGIKMGMMVSGKNVTNFDEKKLALLSPQFMSVLPDETANDTVNVLSPSVLSLHGEGDGLDSMLSLSKALKLMSDTGQDEWINFVMEASGVTETVDKLRDAEAKEQTERQKDFVDDEGRPLYFTKENVTQIYGEYEATKLDVFDKIYKSMSPEQMEIMNTTGYSIMNNEQLHMMYGDGSPYNSSETLEKFKNIDERQMPGLIEDNIRLVAQEKMKFDISRKKDVVLNPLILTSVVLDPVTASQSIVLSPLVLSPLVLSPSIYGNVILSPWVFVPVIVSPRVLGAIVLSPVVFSPAILTPLCLVPVILSPAVGLPLILSPFVLSPFILSPVVLSPLILSPFCLSPFIGVPNVLTPIILSPFVLSPLILSPPFISAFVLSPYALSPAIASNGALFTAILSPSWLSTL